MNEVRDLPLNEEDRNCLTFLFQFNSNEDYSTDYQAN